MAPPASTLKRLPAPAIPPEFETVKRQLRSPNQASSLIDRYLEDPAAVNVPWPFPIAQALEALTIKQRQFTVRVSAGEPAVSALRKAYNIGETRTEDSVLIQASTLKSDRKVRLALTLMLGWLDRKWLSDGISVKDHVQSVLYDESVRGDSSSARISAAGKLAQLNGLLVTRSEVTIRDGNLADRQEELIESLLGQLGVETAIEADFERVNVLQTKDLTLPSGGAMCSRCKHHLDVVGADVGGDGAGI